MKISSINDFSDSELVDLIKEGDASKPFGILYQRYQKRVLDKCYGFVKNKTLAKELSEDVFSKTFEKIPSFKQNSAFSSWLYMITYNHCIDYLRLKQKLHYPKWNEENEIPEIVDETDEHLSDIDYDKLMLIMEEIHPEEKALLLMKYQDGLPMKDIGTVLRISESAAKMRLKRARNRVLYLYTKRFSNY
jgi:RNA polymerase sigma factor (sigma-70 family)